jgi:hypothetical protein
VAAGGYIAVSEDLDRRPAWPPSRQFASWRSLTAELRAAAAEVGAPPRRLPTRSELLGLGRPDLHGAVAKHGGYVAVAKRMGWRTARRPVGEALGGLEEAAAAVKEFAIAAASGTGGGGGGALGLRGSGKGGSRMPEGGGGGFGAVLRMPTHEELRAAGRHDLRRALQVHGSGAVAAVLGLGVSRRGRKRGVNGGGGGKGGEDHEKTDPAH